jgi:hypothetical protein
MVPVINRDFIGVASAIVGCILFKRSLPKIFNGLGLPEFLTMAFLFVPLVTAMLNDDRIVIGSRILPGETLYDGLSACLQQAVLLIPYLLGRQLFRERQSSRDIIRALTVAGLGYSVLILFEVRMSPQLHYWIYGYYPSGWIQQVRDYGYGYRPMVFIGHGLYVAFFIMCTVVAASVLWRMRLKVYRLSGAMLTGYLAAILVLCQTLSAILYAAFLVPFVRWMTPKAQVRLAVVLVTVALAYPVLRTLDLVPTNEALRLAEMASAGRAASLQVRFDNEQQLLAKAHERPWFGWGRWGRNRVYENEGYDWTITDGAWIIILGTFGIAGFVAEFGLLALPVFRAASSLRRISDANEQRELACLALLVAVSVFDLLPNSILSPFGWLVAGALLARTEALQRSKSREARSIQATRNLNKIDGLKDLERVN